MSGFGVLVMHTVSDLVIFAAYMLLGIWSFIALRSKGLTISVLFGLFILLCGFTHFDAALSEIRGVCEVGSLFYGIVKAVTAVVSSVTATVGILWLSVQVTSISTTNDNDNYSLRRLMHIDPQDLLTRRSAWMSVITIITVGYVLILLIGASVGLFALGFSFTSPQ